MKFIDKRYYIIFNYILTLLQVKVEAIQVGAVIAITQPNNLFNIIIHEMSF